MNTELETPLPCGSRNCPEPRAPGRYVCTVHAVDMDRIREAFQAESQRKMRRVKRVPTCCFTGCYEPRPRTSAFCHRHRDEVEESD